MSFLKNRSAQTLIALSLYMALAGSLPDQAHLGLYTFSMVIKDILIWIMPLTVGFFIAYTVASFEKKAPLFVVMILLFEACSNTLSVWYAYGISHGATAWLPKLHVAPFSESFEPLWHLPISPPQWWNAQWGALTGLILGFVSSALKSPPLLMQFLAQGKAVVEWMLTRFFSKLLPVFVLGFAAKMYKTHLLSHVAQHYALASGYVALAIGVYLLALVGVGAYQSSQSGMAFLKAWGHHLKNLLLPAGIAFSTGCSLSTMPWTIQGASKNMNHPSLAQAVIPATTNIQQVGDCILQGFMCATIYHTFFGHLPDLQTWASFSLMFVLARFATVAMLGGAIFLMLPLYETYLHFTPEMIALVLALNTVLDPLVTSSNVLGNGALCRIFERVWVAFQPQAHYAPRKTVSSKEQDHTPILPKGDTGTDA